MTMEQIADTDAADFFLRQVYDWNIYAAGYVIAEAREITTSPEMQIVILAMFAERRWDLINATARKASDTLSLIRTNEAREFLEAASLQRVFELVNNAHGEREWFGAWRELFTHTPGTASSDEEVRHISDRDSVMGWTCSNVLKRLRLSDAQQGLLREFLGSDEEVIRWRAAHVLGAFPSPENVDILLRLLEADARAVRYGATRSLVEMAALTIDDRLRRVIFEGFANRAGAIQEHRSVLEEFERAIFINKQKAPQGWTRLAASVIERFQRQSTTWEQGEHWSRLVQRLIDEYGV